MVSRARGSERRSGIQKMSRIRLILIGAGQRGEAYGRYALTHPGETEVVAVVDPSLPRRAALGRQLGVPSEGLYASWEECLDLPRFADAVVVATPDNQHIGPATAALRAGYDVLLEKPISRSPAECLALGDLARELGRTVLVCHVLRYSPFFTELKRLVDSGALGQIVAVNQVEGVGFWHQAHSFVRGNWRREEESSPMILAKSCHDMDILRWLVGRECRRVASFGELTHFTAKNAPEGAPERCTDGCPQAETCLYQAPRFYLTDPEHWVKKILRKVVALEATDEAVMEALKTGPYGRCVYRCDNDVVDHQSVILQFDGGATATFTMSAFTEGGRTIELMGTRAQARGDMEGNRIEVYDFRSGERREIRIDAPEEGHGGGDEGIVRDFCAVLRGEHRPPHVSTIEVSIESHLMALAAEESRRRGGSAVAIDQPRGPLPRR